MRSCSGESARPMRVIMAAGHRVGRRRRERLRILMTDTDRLPRIFVIGAAKAGTSSLARWLDDHPDVAVARQKEVNFFSYDPVWNHGGEWYASQFPANAVGWDPSPSYLPAPEAAGRMHQTQPAARIIALLRDPVERTYVH